MNKIKINTHAFPYPMPMVIVGTIVDEKANFMAVGWVNRVNYKPPLIGVGLGNHHYTNIGIMEQKSFSINIPSIDLMEKTDYCGLVSGKNVDKSEIFETFFGTIKTAPMIKECALNMECKLIKTIEFATNQLFIGEIISAYTEEKYMTDNKPDIQKIKPFTLTMPDNNFWAIGENLGKAWSIGNRLKK